MCPKNDNIILPILNVQTKFLLTDLGENYFINKNIPMRDIVTIEGNRGSGFIWGNYKSKLIEKFIVGRLIDEIDIERSEILTKIKDICELSKLVYFSMLYKKFRPELIDVLYNSEMMETIKQENPQIKITKNLKFNSEIVKKFLESNSDAISAAKEVLAVDAFAIIDNDKEITEKESKKRIITSFIGQIDQNMWFLFHFLSKTGGAFELMKAMNEILINYTMKTKIVDKLNPMLMDMLKIAEKAHFSRLARLKQTAIPEITPDNIDTQFEKPEIKQKLMEYAKNTKTFINFFIKFPQEGISTNNRLRLSYNLSLRGDIDKIMRRMKPENEKKQEDEKENQALQEMQAIKNDIAGNNSKSKSTKQKNRAGNTILENHFNSLQSECAQEKIKFVANMDSDEKKEESYVVITLQI